MDTRGRAGNRHPADLKISIHGDGAYGAGGAPTELGDGSSTVIVEEDLFASGAPGSQQDFEINVGDRVFFGFDSTTLDDDARQRRVRDDALDPRAIASADAAIR